MSWLAFWTVLPTAGHTSRSRPRRLARGIYYALIALTWACGARSDLPIPADGPACEEPAPPPPCAACRLDRCKGFQCGGACIDLQLCAQRECGGLNIDDWGPSSPLTLCLQACAAPYDQATFEAFHWRIGCSRFETECDPLCHWPDDYEECLASTGTCPADPRAVAERCMLVWWIGGPEGL